MQETTITKICFTITIVGMLLFLLTYEPEFQKTTLYELKESQNSEAKGIVFARIDYVIKTYPITEIIINDGESALLYYPKSTDLKKNDFIFVYIQKNDNNSFYAYKVTKDD